MFFGAFCLFFASKNVSKWGPPFINECIKLKTFQYPKQQQKDAIFYECNLMHSIELGTDKISVSWCSRADPGIKFGQYKPNFSADKPTSSVKTNESYFIKLHVCVCTLTRLQCNVNPD